MGEKWSRESSLQLIAESRVLLPYHHNKHLMTCPQVYSALGVKHLSHGPKSTKILLPKLSDVFKSSPVKGTPQTPTRGYKNKALKHFMKQHGCIEVLLRDQKKGVSTYLF